MFKKDESYLGSIIKQWAEDNKETDEVAKTILQGYFSDSASNYANINVYYFVDEENKVLKRDLIKSSRFDKIYNIKLSAMVNNEDSYLGSEIKEEVMKELKHEMCSPKVKAFYADTILSNNYSPANGVYYFLKYNTSGKYYVKRDIIRSPKQLDLRGE